MTNDNLQQLAERARDAMAHSDDGFPDTWNGDPNPIITDSLPPLIKPQNAESPLFEFRPSDGPPFTLWVSNNLFQALRRAGAEVGEPCVILRSDEKVDITLSSGKAAQAWQWVVTTERGTSMRSGQAMTLDSYAQRAGLIATGDGDVVEAEAELVPEPSALDAAPSDEDIPF